MRPSGSVAKKAVIRYCSVNKVCNIVLLRRRAMWLKRGIEPFEFDTGISGGKAPIDRGESLIATLLPDKTSHLGEISYRLVSSLENCV
jgi:hypothetical protein